MDSFFQLWASGSEGWPLLRDKIYHCLWWETWEPCSRGPNLILHITGVVFGICTDCIWERLGIITRELLVEEVECFSQH